MSEPTVETIARGLADRFRVLARALDRLDRLEGERDFAEWLTRLGADRPVLAQLATTLALESLRAATEEANYRILGLLAADETVSLATLCAEGGIDRASLYLRLGRLTHAGLVTLELDAEAVRSTPLGRAVHAWLAAIVTETSDRIAEWLELVGGRSR